MPNLSPQNLKLLQCIHTAPNHTITISKLESAPPCDYLHDRLASLLEQSYIAVASFTDAEELNIPGVIVIGATPFAYTITAQGVDALDAAIKQKSRNCLSSFKSFVSFMSALSAFFKRG